MASRHESGSTRISGPTEGVRGGWLHEYTYGAHLAANVFQPRRAESASGQFLQARLCRGRILHVELDPVQRVSAEEIRRERLALAPEFQQWSDEDLATHASVLTARKATDYAHAESAPPADGDHA